MVALLSLDKAVSGIDATSRFGVNRKDITPKTSMSNSENVLPVHNVEDDSFIMEEYLNEACDEPNTNPSEQTLSYTPHRRIQRERVPNKEILLQKQVDNQIKYQENSAKLMSEIDQNMKKCVSTLTDVNQNLADVKKYLKRSCDWQERQYKLAKEKFEFKKRNEVEKTKRKILQLDLKKQVVHLKSEKYGVAI